MGAGFTWHVSTMVILYPSTTLGLYPVARMGKIEVFIFMYFLQLVKQSYVFMEMLIVRGELVFVVAGFSNRKLSCVALISIYTGNKMSLRNSDNLCGHIFSVL